VAGLILVSGLCLLFLLQVGFPLQAPSDQLSFWSTNLSLCISSETDTSSQPLGRGSIRSAGKSPAPGTGTKAQAGHGPRPLSALSTRLKDFVPHLTQGRTQLLLGLWTHSNRCSPIGVRLFSVASGIFIVPWFGFLPSPSRDHNQHHPEIGARLLLNSTRDRRAAPGFATSDPQTPWWPIAPGSRRPWDLSSAEQ
jgi:hypothetical protein